MLEPYSSRSFDQLVVPHLDAAYNLARWLTRNERDAEDGVQESCLRAVRFFSGFRGDEPRAWLMKIVRNTCYSWLQANRPLQTTSQFDEALFDPNPGSMNPEQVLLQNDRVSLLRCALEMLPVNFREILILRELEGLSYKEIAEVTGMPSGTVMSSLSRTRSRLRLALATLANQTTSPLPRTSSTIT